MRHFQPAAALLALATALAARADSKTTISGKIYTDFTYRQADDATHKPDARTGTGLDLKRFYLTVDHSFNDVWGARFRSDVGDLSLVKVSTKKNDSGVVTDVTGGTGHVDVFVKNAYIEAKLAQELVLRAGAADLPWVPFAEDLWGFRYVELQLIDRAKFGTSADWGLHATGKIGGGLVNYAVSVVNGRGYGDWTRAQAPTAEGRIALVPIEGLTLAVGGQVGKLGQNVLGTPTPNVARRGDALVAWVGHGLRLGVEGFIAKDYTSDMIKGAAAEDRSLGVSGWAAYEVVPQLTVFGRVDHVQPRKNTNSDLKETYAVGGLEYKPVKAVNLAAVFKYDQAKAGTVPTANGDIIGSSDETGKYYEAGLFAQYVF